MMLNTCKADEIDNALRGINMSEINDVIKMLDNMAQGGVSRIKVETSEDMADGEVKKAYHHGRCDVGSPFATGKLFDLEEPS